MMMMVTRGLEEVRGGFPTCHLWEAIIRILMRLAVATAPLRHTHGAAAAVLVQRRVHYLHIHNHIHNHIDTRVYDGAARIQDAGGWGWEWGLRSGLRAVRCVLCTGRTRADYRGARADHATPWASTGLTLASRAPLSSTYCHLP